MHTHFLRNSLVASALVCAFAAAPVSQVLAQDAATQGSNTNASQAMHSGAMRGNQMKENSDNMQSGAMQGDQMKDGSDNQTLPGKANDGWITTKVKSKLAAAKNVKSTDISVETNEGMVTLTGTVPTKSAKNHAVKDAKSIKGVKSVDASGLTVGGMQN